MNVQRQQLKALVFECLKGHGRGQVAEVAERVLELAYQKQLFGLVGSRGSYSRSPERERFHMKVEEVMWEMFVHGLLFPGYDESNRNWPFYHLSDYGKRVVDQGAPQPYDPDGFLAEFK